MGTDPGSELRYPEAPGGADLLSQSGLELLAEGRSARAAEVFQLAVAADPTHVEAHHGLIRALRDCGRIDEAVYAAKSLTEITPGDPLAFTSFSIALQQADRIPEAENAAARARILEWKQQLAEPEPPPENLASIQTDVSAKDVLL